MAAGLQENSMTNQKQCSSNFGTKWLW